MAGALLAKNRQGGGDAPQDALDVHVYHRLSVTSASALTGPIGMAFALATKTSSRQKVLTASCANMATSSCRRMWIGTSFAAPPLALISICTFKMI